MTITTVIQTDSGLDVVQYKADELLNRLNTVMLAISPGECYDSLIKKTAEKSLKRLVLIHDGIDYPLYYNKAIKFHDPPISGSPGSAARYYVWDESSGLALQIIRDGVTSCNRHTKGHEKFYSVLGESHVCICSYGNNSPTGDVTLKEGNSLILYPNYWHRLDALSPALNILLMSPGAGRSDHHYPERCVRGLC
jgi:hypothetical protein